MRILYDNRFTIVLGFLLILNLTSVNDIVLQKLITNALLIVIVGFNLFYKSILFRNFFFNRKRVFIPSVYDIRSKIIDIVIIVALFVVIWINIANSPTQFDNSGLNEYYLFSMIIFFIIWALLKNSVTEIVFGKKWIRIKKYGKTMKKLQKIEKIVLDDKTLNLEYDDYVFQLTELRLSGKIDSLIEKIRENNSNIEIEHKT